MRASSQHPELLSARKGVKMSWGKYPDQPLGDEYEIIRGLTKSGLSPSVNG